MGSRPSQSQSTYAIKDALSRILCEVVMPTAFACGHSIEDAPNPGLFLNDYGTIGLPLSKQDADIIISKSRQSPFGKGSETLVDTSIRKSWDLDPSQFTLCNPQWDKMMGRVLRDVSDGLRLSCGDVF